MTPTGYTHLNSGRDMPGSTALYIASTVIFVWGVAHIAAFRSVVEGFGVLSTDNRRIITMEWIAEGLTLAFIGVLTFLVTVGAETLAPLVVRTSAVMLLAMAAMSATTGARTAIVPMKLCPFVKTVVAGLMLFGSSGFAT